MKKFLTIVRLLICFIAMQIYAADKNTIYIYSDEGVGEESLTQTLATFEKFLSPRYVIQKMRVFT